MATTDKNIVITPNIGQTSDPKIVFSGADASTAAQNITLYAYPTNSGTLSFEGSAGQLFSITNSLSGTIFSVNDVSGIPSIEVLDTGTIKLAQYSGNVGVGNSTPTTKLDVTGTVTATAFAGPLTGNATTATTLATARTIAISGDVTGTATSFNGSAAITISSAITADSIVNADINSAAGIVDTKLATIATAGKVSNSATTATNANTALAIVARDASGNFTAGTITAALSGNSTTATTTPLVSVDNSIAYGRSGLQFVQLSNAAGDVATTTNTPTADWWHIIRGNHSNVAGYYTDLALPMTAATNIRYRRISAGVSSGWIPVLDSTNYNSYSPTLTGTGASGSWGISVTGSSASTTGNAATVTNGVYTTGNQSIAGIKTFSNGTASTTNTTGSVVITGGLGVSGAINAGADVTAYAASDIRLKTNIENIPDALAKVNQLNGVTYNWNDLAHKEEHKDTSVREVGVIAQQVDEVLPEVITVRDNGYMAVRYEKMVPLLIEAIKELTEQNRQLAQRLSDLEDKN